MYYVTITHQITEQMDFFCQGSWRLSFASVWHFIWNEWQPRKPQHFFILCNVNSRLLESRGCTVHGGCYVVSEVWMSMYEVPILWDEHPVFWLTFWSPIFLPFGEVLLYLSTHHQTSPDHSWSCTVTQICVGTCATSTVQAMRFGGRILAVCFCVSCLLTQWRTPNSHSVLRFVCWEFKVSLSPKPTKNYCMSMGEVCSVWAACGAGSANLTVVCKSFPWRIPAGVCQKWLLKLWTVSRKCCKRTTPWCLCVIANRTGLSLHIIRNRLQVKKHPAKWIPHTLLDAQKRTRLCMARGLLTHFRRTPSLHDRVITGDESWFFCYEPETKRSTSAWLSKNEEHPPKPVKDRYVRKVMLIIFWDLFLMARALMLKSIFKPWGSWGRRSDAADCPIGTGKTSGFIMMAPQLIGQLWSPTSSKQLGPTSCPTHHIHWT